MLFRSKLDPYKILEGSYDPLQMVKESMPDLSEAELDKLSDIIRNLTDGEQE